MYNIQRHESHRGTEWSSCQNENIRLACTGVEASRKEGENIGGQGCGGSRGDRGVKERRKESCKQGVAAGPGCRRPGWASWHITSGD